MNKRQIVFNKYGGKCAYCGCDLDEKFQVDHMVSKNYWYHIDSEDPSCVNDISNLMPACVQCNHYKRSHCLEDKFSHVGFRTYMLSFHIRLGSIPKKTIRPSTIRRKEYMQRIADRYGISETKPFDGLFYFEKMQRQMLGV